MIETTYEILNTINQQKDSGGAAYFTINGRFFAIFFNQKQVHFEGLWLTGAAI